jgi:hypothetical protein
MIMEARAKRLSTPLQWGRREKAVVGALLALLAAALVALGVYAASGGSAARADCIRITFPSTLGAAEIHACGAKARTVCSSGDRYKGIAEELRLACGRAGYPYVASK